MTTPKNQGATPGATPVQRGLQPPVQPPVQPPSNVGAIYTPYPIGVAPALKGRAHAQEGARSGSPNWSQSPAIRLGWTPVRGVALSRCEPEGMSA